MVSTQICQIRIFKFIFSFFNFFVTELLHCTYFIWNNLLKIRIFHHNWFEKIFIAAELFTMIKVTINIYRATKIEFRFVVSILGLNSSVNVFVKH